MITTIKESKPIAKKRYQCDFCCGHIKPGERYIRNYFNNDGDCYEWKSHIECEWICSYLDMYADADDGVTGDIFQEEISERYANIMSDEYNDLWESDTFVMPSFEEKLKFVIDYYKRKNNHER